MQPQDPTPSDPLAPREAPEAAEVRLQRRRRMLLRAGAGVVPISLTLASRPVRAWHCNTSSAWGSAQVNPNASTTARNEANDLDDETWTISNWKTNTTRAGLSYPWSKVKNKWFPMKTTTYARNTLTISQVFGTSIPAGLAANDIVYKLLNDQTNAGNPRTVSDFQKYMIVAQLNATFIPNVAACLKSNGTDQLAEMIDGNYQPSNISTTGPWSQATIMQYLTDNYIVVP